MKGETMSEKREPSMTGTYAFWGGVSSGTAVFVFLTLDTQGWAGLIDALLLVFNMGIASRNFFLAAKSKS